jgi:hypothetical protein
LLLRLYPPSFRERYGDELQALVEDTSPSPRLTLDLALGAGRAWIGPRFGGSPEQRRRARLLATILTVFWSWTLVLVAFGSFNQMVNDPAVPGLGRPLAEIAFHLSQVAMAIATGLIVVGAVIYWGVIAAASRRERSFRTLLVATIPVGAGLVWLGASQAVVWLLLNNFAAHRGQPPRVGVLVAVLIAWWLVSVALTCLSWVSVGVAMRRADLSVRLLRPGLIGAVMVVASLVVAVVAMAITVICLRGPGGLPLTIKNLVFGYGVVPLAAASAGIAFISGRRGLRANRDIGALPGPLHGRTESPHS